jgi:hypothetical protein
VAALLYLVPIGHAFAVTPALESEVKATFLYKFTSFVDWPADAFGSPQDPLTICIIGDDEVARVIDRAAAGQRSGGHPILVRHLDRIQRQSRCQVLYAAPSQRQTMTQALEAVRGRPVLTITDQAGSPAVMGMITFVVEDNRVRFDIDDQAAATAGLTISSRLLILARTVIPRS